MYPSTSATSSTHTTYFPFATINIAEAERQSVCTLLATTATAEPSSAPTSTFSTSEIGYALREVGNCEGHVFIESKEECEAAALDLEVLSAGTSVRAGSWSNRPHGCFIRTATCSGEAVTSFCHSVRKVWAADRGEVVFNHDGNVENSDTDRVSICTRTTTASGAKSPVQLFADLYTRNEPIMHCPAPFSDTLSQALHFPGVRPTFSSNFIHAQTDVLNAPACVALCIGFVGCKSCTFKASDVLCQLYPETYAAAAYQTASTTTDLYSLVPCVAPCPATAVERFGMYTHRQPRFTSEFDTEAYVDTPAACAVACVVGAGAGRCQSFTFLHGNAAGVNDPSFGQCRLYPAPYRGDALSDDVVADDVVDYYVLRDPQGCVPVPHVSEAWLHFAAGQENSPNATHELPTFSYSGYAQGERVPSSDDAALPVFRVADFASGTSTGSGLPNDNISDSPAIRMAIRAAELAGGGRVVFDGGTYLINTEQDAVPLSDVCDTDCYPVQTSTGEMRQAESIQIRGSNIILQGAGSRAGGTVIHQVLTFLPLPGAPIWSAHYALDIRPDPAPFDSLSQALHFPGARPTFSSNFIHAQTDVLNAPACVALCIGFVGCKSCTFKASDVLCQLYPKTYAAAAYQTASTTTDLYSLVPCAPGANITANVEVGSFSANVAGPTIHLLRAGDMVKLTMQSAAPSTVGRFLAPQTVHSTWRPLEDITDDEHGIRVEEMHIVAEVVGTRVRFREPIQVSIRAEEGWTLRRVPYLNEVGIEDIGFMGSWTGNNSGTEGFVHHGDAVNDGGWKFIGMQQVLDGWIRRCTFINSASPIIISSSVSVSVYQVTVAGTPGHFPLVISGSYGVFVGLFEDLAGFWHGPAVKSRACSTVFWRCSWQAAEPFDCHGSQPYTTLVDVAKVRSSTRQPGRSNPPPLNSRSGGSA